MIPINYSPALWQHADVRIYNIGGQADLMLFKTDDNKTIIFPLAAIEQGFIEYAIPKASCLQSELTVYFHTSRGRVQGSYSKPYTKYYH
jgi:hypothetical protein